MDAHSHAQTYTLCALQDVFPLAQKTLSLLTASKGRERWSSCVRAWEHITGQKFKFRSKPSSASPSSISYGVGTLPVPYCDPATALHSALGLARWKTSESLLRHGHPDGIAPIALCRKGMQDHTNSTSTHPILPLHIALANHAPLHLVTLLLATDTTAAKALVGQRSTALHLAVSNGANVTVVKAVRDAWPDAAHQTDGMARTPLDLALGISSERAVVMLLRGEADDAETEGGHDGGITAGTQVSKKQTGDAI